MITANWIEGGAVYALPADLRETIIAAGEATLNVALASRSRNRRPDRAAVAPKGKPIRFKPAAQGRASFARGHWSAAETAITIGRIIVVAVPASLAGLINTVPIG